MEEHGCSHQTKGKKMNWFLVTICRREFLLGRDVQWRGIGGWGVVEERISRHRLSLCHFDSHLCPC